MRVALASVMALSTSLAILALALLGSEDDRPTAPEPSAADLVAQVERDGPTIAEVQEAAERSSVVQLSDARSMRRRARLAALLPELSAGVRRDLGEVDTLGLFAGTGVDTHNVDNMAHYDVRATWRLPEVVFARQEVQTAQALAEAQRLRDERSSRVTDLYYEWRRLRLTRRLAPPTDRAALLRLDLDIEERQARLDALTGGYVGRKLREARGHR